MTAREAALQVVRDVFPASGRGRSAQDALDYRVRREGLDLRDRAFATELAYGAIKMRRTLDWYLDPFVGDRRATLPSATHEVLRLAIYELRFTRAEEYATVSQFVDLAKRYGHRGLAGLTNAILRGFLREAPPEPARERFESDDDYLGTKHSLPTWLVRQWRAVFGAQRVEGICAGVNLPPQHAITVNRLRIDLPALAERLRGEGTVTRPSPFAPDSLLVESGAAALRDRPAEGQWWVQSESSAIAVEVLQPHQGEQILDVCSGRGNKALQIGSRLGADGDLCCVDRDQSKVRVLQLRLAEYGIPAATLAGDATDEQLFAPERRFDRVLLDAPCSGIGVVGRHPEARWRKQSQDAERLSAAQSALLHASANRVYEGGALVYAVCSTDPRESVEVVEDFAARHNFARGLVPGALDPFLTDAGDILIPPGIDGRDGFYVSRLERRL
ncbi:MAG TPA: transcription antitermination factor NusB [Candidatus Tyrphobacter sp.]